jgi:phosphoesterase RecJ-like protein
MPLNEAALQSGSELLRAAQRILLISHKRPDGDAIGSLLGFGLALSAAGKDVQMVSVDGVPGKLKKLEGSELIRKRIDGQFDLICVLDCSDLERIGDVFEDNPLQPDLNIDHHRTNLNYARINLVDQRAVSTTQILVELLDAAGIPLTQPSADALLTGLITDSLGFRTANMTPEALRLAADLVEFGCSLHDNYRRVLGMRSYEATRLWGAGLHRITRDEGIVWTSLTLADRDMTGYPGRDDADLVNVLVSVDDADVALIFLEQPGEMVKVSWRSQPEIDVSGVATLFGGGGHANAAGAEISGPLEVVQSNVLDATKSLLNGYSRSVDDKHRY